MKLMGVWALPGRSPVPPHTQYTNTLKHTNHQCVRLNAWANTPSKAQTHK